MDTPLPRSYLFVPGNRPDRFDKALAAGADAVIVDLEDAVPMAAKDDARKAVAAWLAPSHPVVIRINGPDTDWFGDDVALCGLPGVAAVMVPKAEQRDPLHRVARVAPGRAILPLIESAAGFDNARTLATCDGVQRLVFGSIDFQLDLGIQGDEELLFYRSQLVLVSRLARRGAPVDGVTAAFDDDAALQRDTERARRLGFGAKLCIHPRQVSGVNRGLAPSEAEVTWARRVVAAAQQAQGAAVAVDGKMIDRPVILRAQALLDDVDAHAGNGNAAAS
jgi:citrate lyase subunit beta / citryl-CoA lyase